MSFLKNVSAVLGRRDPHPLITEAVAAIEDEYGQAVEKKSVGYDTAAVALANGETLALVVGWLEEDGFGEVVYIGSEKSVGRYHPIVGLVLWPK